MRLGITAFLLLCPFFWAARADLTVRNQVGIGYTDNANFEDVNRDADGFLWARVSLSDALNNSFWNVWLNYRSYLKEIQNNVVNYRLGGLRPLKLNKNINLDWDFGLGGQQYTEKSPGVTEDSFNNQYAETSVTKRWYTSRGVEISLEPFYQVKVFSNFEGRVDHVLLANLATAWSINGAQLLTPYTELGFVRSNNRLYSRNYFELGGDWQFFYRQDLKYILSFLSRKSTFPSRTISEETIISINRGRTITLSQSESEAHSYFQIQAAIVKMLNKVEAKSSISVNNQTSRSGFEDYSEVLIQGSLLYLFE